MGDRLVRLLLTAAMTMASTAVSAESASPSETLSISSDLRVVVLRGREIAVEARAGKEESYASVAARLAGGRGVAEAVEAWNDAAPIEEGSWVQVPLALLSDEYRSLALRSLFPDDRREGEDWIHFAHEGRVPTYDAGLWQVAVWFAGDGDAFDALREANDLASPELRDGQPVRIPGELLHRAFRARMRSSDGALEFGKDRDGPYAAYRLAPGEAVYSAVVVKFTGRTAAEDVGSLSQKIAARSGIPDMTDIPAGFDIKIPLDLLEPQYLPEGHPRRIEMEARRSEMARELDDQPVGGARRGLSGVLVILDPGHGGRDMGTAHNGVWEHDYVYDVTCRLKHKLERSTSATVRLTLMDEQTGCRPSTADKLVANKQGTILTTPPFLAREEGEAQIGVNLRWYLANSIYRQALKDGYDSDRVLFLSLHADSRHPSLRGLMVYVPGAAYRTKTYGKSGGVYKKFREVREKPHVRFSKKERLRSEAVSRRLADQIVESFRDESLPVQPHEPVRDKVIRGKSRWVPAVLRGNAVPNKTLVEMLNLSNRDDARMIASARERDRLADALLRSILRYYGEPVGSGGGLAAAD